MKGIQKKVEVASNIAIILVAFLLGGVLIYRFVLSDPPKTVAVQNKKIENGTKFDLPNANWNKSEKTLVMALSTNCRYCSESTPFYQKLVEQKAENENVRLVVVTPQDLEQTKDYLAKHKLSVDEIKQSTLNKIKVGGTPTLILVDKNGAVVESWVGKLPPEKEAEVINRLFG
ncbi:MAG: peroxiredoxin family protein [Aridibacter sp.]